MDHGQFSGRFRFFSPLFDWFVSQPFYALLYAPYCVRMAHSVPPKKTLFAHRFVSSNPVCVIPRALAGREGEAHVDRIPIYRIRLSCKAQDGIVGVVAGSECHECVCTSFEWVRSSPAQHRRTQHFACPTATLLAGFTSFSAHPGVYQRLFNAKPRFFPTSDVRAARQKQNEWMCAREQRTAVVSSSKLWTFIRRVHIKVHRWQRQ